ncbi:hypothetical protein YC2023_078832 [Brassica napus]
MRRTTWTYITNIPPQHLEWNRRKHLICKEISRYNPSILCLQAKGDVCLAPLSCFFHSISLQELDTQLHDPGKFLVSLNLIQRRVHIETPLCI